jgi:uncharacterized membrane protein
MIKQKFPLHYLSLVGIIVLGAILRFTNLDLKPLWMDEVITTIFSLGKNYKDLPLDTVFPLTKLIDIFTYQPGITCPDIAANIASQSTHPPLFFCTMYGWLGWLQPLGENWIWKMRSLPAIFGIAAIFVIYWVNRIAFSPKAGIAAAACMAVSPFAVYLSQEARHYTLPMLLVSLAILGLIQIQQDIFAENQSRKKRWWYYWIIINSISLYVHYFCILALIAQVATLVSLLIWQKAKILAWKQTCLMLILSTSAIALSFLPWLLVMLNHSKRSETDWLQPPQHIAPLAQTIINWLLMVISFPVEKQPLPIAIISGFLMLLFGVWLARKVAKGLKTLLLNPESQLPTLTLLSFSIWVILEFFVIIYLLGKDITVVPRYNFIYYPSFCALLAASLAGSREWGVGSRGVERNRAVKGQNTSSTSSTLYSLLPTPLLIGTISCIFLLSNLVFQKPFQPELVAKNFNQEPLIPTMLVVGYSDYQDVALGLSFALAFEHLHSRNQTTLNLPMPEFAFFNKKLNFNNVVQNISQLNLPVTSRLNLWIVASGLRKRDFPQQVVLKNQSVCSRDDKQYYRVGIPYQLYRCGG